MTAIDAAKSLIFTGGTIPTAGASAGDLAAEISARTAASRDGDTITLSNTATSAQNVDATVPASQADIPVSVTGRRLQFTWATANTGPDPTITIDGVAWTIRRRDSTALAAGELLGGCRYVAVVTHTTNHTLRLLDAVAPSDIAGLPTALSGMTNASVDGDIRMVPLVLKTLSYTGQTTG